LIALLRFGAIAAVIAIAGAIVSLRRRDERDFERARAALLAQVLAASAGVTPADEGAVARVESWLVRSSHGYEGDFIDAALRSPGALAAFLARPAVYVRGPIDELSEEAGIARAAVASLKDPLLVCLLEPPPSRVEKAVLAKVREAYAADAERHSPNVRRLREAQAGLPLLAPAWADQVRSAATPLDLDLLRASFEKTPVELAKRAAKAEILVFAIDEAGDADANTPTELDGERPHFVRVGLVDLVREQIVLRVRKGVDPSWISAAKRPLYAAGLDACALAFDVRAGCSALTPR
jgi:hypothetical protein